MAWRTAEDARRKKKQGEEEEQEQETRQIYKPGVERQKRQAAAEAVNASRREQAAKLGVGYLPGDVRVPGSPTQQADGFTGDYRHDAMLADRRAQQQSAWDVAGVTQRVSQTINNGLGMMGLGQAPNSERDYMEMRRFYQLMEDAGRDSGNTELIDRARQGYGSYTARLDDIERQRGGTLAGAGNIDKAGAYFRMFRNAMDTGDLERAEYARSMINSVASSYDELRFRRAPAATDTEGRANDWQERYNRGQEGYVVGMMTGNQELVDRSRQYMEWANSNYGKAYGDLLTETQGPAAGYAYKYNLQELTQQMDAAWAKVEAARSAYDAAAEKANARAGEADYEWNANPRDDPTFAKEQEALAALRAAEADYEVWKQAIALEKGDEFAELEERIPKAAAKTNRTPEGSAVRGQILKGQAAFRRHEQEAIDKVYPNGLKNALLSEEEAAAKLEEIRNGYAESPTMTNNTYQLRQAGYSFAMKKSDMGFGMTDEQKQTFFYLYVEDPEKAEEFAEACKKKNEDAYYAEMSEAETNPAARLWKEFKGANLKLIGGAMPFSVVGQKMSKEGTALAQSVGAGREKYGVMNTGFLSGKLDEDIPIVGGKSLNDWTQLKSSMIMSGETAAAAKVAMATGHPEAAAIIEIAGLYMQSGAAANDDYIQMKRNGWSDNAALTHAIFAGVAEATFEKVSLESLVNQDISRGFVRNLLTQGGVEASEEVATTIANHITDAAIARVNGYDTDRERRAKEYMAQGMSYNKAYNKADVDIMTDLLDDALGGFLSGGLMSGGDYAAHGTKTAVGKVTTGVRNTRDIYTGANLLGMGEDVNLHQRASEGAVNQVQNDSTGGTSAAMQAYAEANKISVKSKDSTRAVLANVEAVTNSIADKMFSKSDTVDGRMVGAVAVYEQTVSEYGEGIKPVAKAALQNTVNKIVTEAGNRGNVSATTAFQEQVGKIENPEARDVAQEALDYAVYRKTTNATQRSEVMEGFRHLDESSAMSEMRAQRNKARGELTMQATVTGEKGQSKAVDIVGITENGKAVELSDGVKIDVRDLQTDADTKDAIQMIASMELGANANKVLQAYRDSGLSGTEGYRFIADYTQAIEQGRTNRVSLERATKASSLDAKTVMEAYTIGQQIAHAETQQAMDRLKNAPKKKGATGRTATIDISAIEGVTMSQSEREQFELANRIFSALGVDLRWVASSERNGRYVGANGSYLNGAVTLDIHAGRNFLNDIRSGILATTGHELTHFLEQYAPEQYKALKEFVFQQIVQNGKYGEETLERLIQEKKKRARNKISQREAENEVVADACQNMLLDSKAVSRFAQEHEDAAKGIVRWLDKWFGKLKSAFTGSRLSEEARMMANLEKNVKQAFGDLWDKALEEAVRMHDEIGDIESEREGKNSDRDTEYLAAVEKKEDWKVEKMVRDAAKKWGAVLDENGKPLHLYHGTPRFGFTVFRDESHNKPFIYASTNRSVSANYAGDQNYAAVRPIGTKYKNGNSTADIIENARWVLGADYSVMDTKAKKDLHDKIRAEAIKVADKADELWQAIDHDTNFPQEIENAVQWINMPFWDMRDADAYNFEEDDGWREQVRENYDSTYNHYEDSKRVVREWFDNNRDKLDKPTQAWIRYLLGYEAGDTAVDVLYTARRLMTESVVLINKGGNVNEPEALKEAMDVAHGIGSYDMYGNLGDKPFVFDAQGAQFWAMKVPEIGDKYYSTDAVSKWALDNGYTSVVMKNIYDYGPKGDNYVFFNSNQLKSADPVTYDDSGNVIPLSERFNWENEDIRYSERDQDANDGEIHTITNEQGRETGIQDGRGTALFSERTYDDGGKEALEKYLKARMKDKDPNKRITKAEMDQVMDSVKEVYDALQEIKVDFDIYKEWAEAEVEKTFNGLPVFSWAKNNTEYGKSMDASLICIKRRTLDAVFDHMIKNGMMDDFDMVQQSIVAINDIIRSHDFEIACGLCYIDAKRYRAAIVADQFVQQYNRLVRSMVPKDSSFSVDYFNYGQNKLVKNSGEGIDTFEKNDKRLSFKEINRVLKENAPGENSSGNVEYKIAKALKEDPKMRRLLLGGDFMSHTGFTEVERSNERLMGLYNAKKGTGGPKATENDTQYLHEVLGRGFTAKKYFDVGGLRVQSFSDYIPRLVFDYVEMVADMAAKKIPSHAYTKELMFALQFGMTGMKINMSLIPLYVKDGVAPGLDANGNYAWRDGQSFGSTVYGINKAQADFLANILGENVTDRLTAEQGFKLAKLIQNANGYSNNCGTIAIGVSNEQIFKMLEDDDIRMVIPYHKSGLNHILASLMGVNGFADYTDQQNTLKKKDGKWVKLEKGDKDFNFNKYMVDHKCDAKTAADAYIAWCEKKGYAPKFSGCKAGTAVTVYDKTADFTKSDGYYKVLEDFNSYDAVTGEAAPQQAVKTVFPGADSAFGDMKSLMRMAIEGESLLQARQDADVPNIVAEIRKTLPILEAKMRDAAGITEEERSGMTTAQIAEREKSAKAEDIKDAYEAWRNENGYRESMRDYDNTVSDVDLLLQQNVEDAANLEQGRLLKEFQAKARQVQELEAKLEQAKAQLKRTDRSYNTRGIQKLIGDTMKTFGMGDAKNVGIQKTAAEQLQKTYDKAISAIDKGENPMEILYQGALELADYLLDNGTFREKQGFHWDRAKWAQVYANTEEARQHAVDEVVSAVYNDFAMKRYRDAVQATAVDKIVDRVEEKYNRKLDAAKAENKALQKANERLQADQKLLKEIEDQQRSVVDHLNEQLQDTRADLKQARKDNSKDVKRLEQKVTRLANDLQKAKERARSWEEKSEHMGKYSQALVDSKNRDIRDLRQKLTAAHAELQAAGAQIEEMKGWEEKAKHAGVYSQQLIDSKNRDIAKLEKEIQKHRDILAGKLRNPQLTALLKAAKEAQYEKDQEAKEAQFAGYKDRRNRTAIRNRIKNLHAELSRDLLRPRERHFVPEKLIRPVVDLLDLVNTQTNRAKSESAQARITAINAAYDAIKKDERYSQFYDETVKDMLVELSGTLAGRSIYDLTTAELEDVYTVMKAMRTTIRNAIKADLIEKGKEIWEIGNEMRQELRAGRGAHALQLLEKYHMTMLSAKRAFNRFGGYQQNSAWNKVYRMLDDAQLKMLTLEMQGTRIFDRVLEGKENLEKAEKLTSYREDDLVDVGLKDETGKAVPIPRGMMLSLYMHLQNEENMRHLMYGGITLPDFKRYYKGRSEAWGQGTVSIPALGARVAALDELFSKGELSDAEYEEAYKEHKAEIDEIFDSIRTAIEEQLTDYDRQWIAASREFFDGFSRRELNRVTNEMYGFSKARVDNYFPIVTDSDFLKSEFESISKNISLENAGFMKERVRASNPIHLEDITKAVNRQISNVSRYAGLTQALKTFGNVYNVQDRGFTDSVKKAMAKTYGKNGQQYVENLITDMVGGRNTPGTIFDRVKGNYAQAVLAANLSVTIKQAASYPTAAATVGWGPLMKALARGGKSNLPISRADSELIGTYSPLLWYRSKGAIDVEIGDLANGRDWTQKAKWLMGWIEKTDIATVGRLWYAAEYYVKDNYNLEKGTEEQIKNGESTFYRKVAEVFADIVEDTQPNYTILQRPDILRNPNKLVRAMVMFSTQRFQNGNILIDAIGEYRAMVRADKQNGTPQTKTARKAARQKLTRAITSQTVSAMVLSAMTLLAGAVMHRMNPWRDDDDELTFESIAEEYLNGFLSSLTGSFLAGSEVYEGLQAMLTGSKYYGNDVGGISTINELATAVIQFEQQAVKLIGDEDSTAKDWQNLAEKQLWKIGEYLSQMTGIPTSNVKKIIEGGRNHIADIMNDEFFSFEAGVDRSTAVNARRYYNAWMAGDNAKVRDVLQDMRDSGKSEDAIKNAISKQAKTAYDAGDIDIDQYAELLDRTGFWDEEKLNGKILDILRDEYLAGARTEKETVDLLIRYNAKVENEDDAWKILQRWEATAEHKGEDGYHYSEYEDLIKDLDAGKTFDEAAAAYLGHGYEEKNLRSNAVSHTKELYQAGRLTDDEAIDRILDYAWKKEDGAYRKLTENEAWMKIKEWRESAGHEEEEDYNYTYYDAIDEAITAGQDISGLVKELTDHGIKQEDVNSHIKTYLVNQYVEGKTNEMGLKNQLSHYLGLTGGEDRDEIVRDANCKKLTGYDYDNLGKGYKAGKITSADVKKALTQYGGMSSAEATARVRYYDFQKAFPDSQLGQSTIDKYYDTMVENVGKTLKGSGIGLDAYVRYAEAASKAKGTDKDGDGKTDSGSKKAAIMQIIDTLNLTTAQKDALYYFNGWSAKTIKEAPWH